MLTHFLFALATSALLTSSAAVPLEDSPVIAPAWPATARRTFRRAGELTNAERMARGLPPAAPRAVQRLDQRGPKLAARLQGAPPQVSVADVVYENRGCLSQAELVATISTPTTLTASSVTDAVNQCATLDYSGGSFAFYISRTAANTYSCLYSGDTAYSIPGAPCDATNYAQYNVVGLFL